MGKSELHVGLMNFRFKPDLINQCGKWIAKATSCLWIGNQFFSSLRVFHWKTIKSSSSLDVPGFVSQITPLRGWKPWQCHQQELQTGSFLWFFLSSSESQIHSQVQVQAQLPYSHHGAGDKGRISHMDKTSETWGFVLCQFSSLGGKENWEFLKWVLRNP